MKFFKTVLYKMTSTGFRRNLGVYLGNVHFYLLKAPWIGKMIWKVKLRKLEDRPYHVSLELTSICNAKCIMCPRHNMEREMKVMDFNLFKKIINECAELGVIRFGLNGYGEIFTAKKYYSQYIDYLQEKIPHAVILINTNGSLMWEEQAQYLIDKKIDTVHIDIDGATQKTFELIREKLNFEDVVDNVKRLVSLKRAQGKIYPKVRVGMIIQKENEHEYKAHYDMWKDIADYTSGDHMVSRLSSVPKYTNEKVIGHPCSLPYFELNIWSDGNVVMCCDDWNAEEKMGNAMTSSVKELWSNEKFKKVRKLHQEGRAGELSTCSKCDWSRPGPGWFQAHRDVE